MRIEPLQSAEPDEVTDKQRAEMDVLPAPSRRFRRPNRNPPAMAR
jgi:hypothetical protein